MNRQRRISRIVLAYPAGLLIVAVLANFFVFGVTPIAIALPSEEMVLVLTLSAAILVGNHTWLMTSTELTRVRYEIRTTPEEWDASERNRSDISSDGKIELERRHNAHRNTTENVLYFVFLALIFSILSPSIWSSVAWILGFALSRFGHTFSYLYGFDSARGLFMSLSLIAMYGLGTYPLLAIFDWN